MSQFQDYQNDMESFIVFKNLMVMMEARGYSIDNFVGSNGINVIEMEELETFNYDYLEPKLEEDIIYKIISEIVPSMSFRTSMSTFFWREATKDEEERLCVVFFANSGDKELAKSEISIFSKLIIQTRDEFSNYRVNNSLEYILVTKNPLNSQSKKEIEEISEGQIIQIWEDIELSFNPLNNKRAGKFVLKNLEESKLIMEKMNLTAQQAPSQTINDKISRYLGARPGQLVYNYRYEVIPGTIVKKSLYPRLVSNRNVPSKNKPIKTAK